MDNNNTIPQWILDIEERAKEERVPIDTIRIIMEDVPRLVEALKDSLEESQKYKKLYHLALQRLSRFENCCWSEALEHEYKRLTKYGDPHA